MLKLGYERIQGERFSFTESPALQCHTKHVTTEFNVCAHMFWAYGELSQLEKLSVASFVHHGYALKLWSYDKIPNLPDGVELCNAREIIAEERVFLNQNKPYPKSSVLHHLSVEYGVL